MTQSNVSVRSFQDLALWEKIEHKRFPVSFNLEITARCNNNCRHCYINLPADDKKVQSAELSLEEISRIADEAVSIGALSCLISGGEPLLRKDFQDLYLCLKRKGLLIHVFTNATLVNKGIVQLFRDYPPRDLEVSVYGVTKETYEKVTRKPGSFAAFSRGLNYLLENNIKVRLKAMALRSNVDELTEISKFCKEKTMDYYRFDPLLHLRFDRNEKRNSEILSERLSAEEIVAIERADPERFESLIKGCDRAILAGAVHRNCDHLFHCAAGRWGFDVSYNGILRPCSSLWHPDFLYDLRKGTVKEAWDKFIPAALDRRSQSRDYHENCHNCQIINICLWCPAHAYLESGALDIPVEYFCNVAHRRKKMLQK